MKVIGLVPVPYRHDQIIVQMDKDEWANILGVGWQGEVPEAWKPCIGAEADIREQWKLLQNIRGLGERFTSTSQALTAVVALLGELRRIADVLNTPPPPQVDTPPPQQATQ